SGGHTDDTDAPCNVASAVWHAVATSSCADHRQPLSRRKRRRSNWSVGYQCEAGPLSSAGVEGRHRTDRSVAGISLELSPSKSPRRRDNGEESTSLLWLRDGPPGARRGANSDDGAGSGRGLWLLRNQGASPRCAHHARDM